MYQKSFFIAGLKKLGVTKHPETQRNLKHSKTSELARLYFLHQEKADTSK
ncbi:DUF2639 domain-containing protein [Rossellomorea marisflavi]